MDTILGSVIKKYSDNEHLCNKIIVSYFIEKNKIKVSSNRLIKSLILPKKDLSKLGIDIGPDLMSFDTLIEAFELAVPSKELIINGAVYTPSFIKNFIIEESLKCLKRSPAKIHAIDISCGCGGFLFTMANELKRLTGKSFNSIFSQNIYGCDISKSSIKRTQILLSLMAVANNEDKPSFDFNLVCANSLSKNWISQMKTDSFDLVIGNPPYVRAKNIDSHSKKLLNDWNVTKSGNPDLYIPFFEIGLKILKTNGVLGYITVNSFYKSVNARELRKFFQQKQYKLKIHDFGHEKIFGNKSTYTCICLISNSKSDFLEFRSESKATLQKKKKIFTKINYSSLDHARGWILNDQSVIENINKIESTGTPLGKLYKIKNGIATLKNDLYIFKPLKETANHYLTSRNDIEYKIEKNICRDIIKPNILKDERDIDSVREKLIFPYKNGHGKLTLLDENFIKTKYPNAYKYLTIHKSELLKRDKGNGNYSSWYAFGRTQALLDNGYKLLFPYMAKTPQFVYTAEMSLLIYCGYAIFSESPNKLHILKKILKSRVFNYYMINTSKPYSAGYFSYAKNYVKNFGVCDLDKSEEDFLIKSNVNSAIDSFLIKKYGINI